MRVLTVVTRELEAFAGGLRGLLEPRGARSLHSPNAIVWLLLASTLAAFWPSVVPVVRLWSSSVDYSHGGIVAAIAFIWLWQVRGRVDALPATSQPSGLLAMAGAVLVWMIGSRANSEVLQQLMVPVVLWLAVLAALGSRIARLVLAPIAFLYFAMPVWDHALPLLQSMSVAASEFLLHLLNVPAQVEGHHVSIPAGQFTIVEGCSGKRYLIVSLPFAVLTGVMQGLRGWRLGSVMLLAAAVAMITNWLRIVMIIYAGYVSDMQHYLVAVEHVTLGYALFVPMLLAIGFAASRLARGQQALPDAPRSRAGSTPDSPARSHDSPDPHEPPVRLWMRAVAPLGLLAVPFGIAATSPSPDPSTVVALQPLPVLTGEWQGPLPADDRWLPEFIAPSDERRASYAGAGGRIELYVNSYGVQTPGRELVYYRNAVAPNDRWTQIKDVPAEHSPFRTAIAVTQAGERWVVARTYVVAGRVITQPPVAQLYYGLRALWRPVPSGVIALAAPCAGDCAAVARQVQQFWGDNSRWLITLVPQRL